MKFTLTLLFVILASLAIAVDGTAGPYRIELRTDPATIPVGRAKLFITLTDSAGKPAAKATLKVLAQMPGMPMGERFETAKPGGTPGTYSAPAVFGMGGTYDIKISIAGPLGAGETTLSLATGESTSKIKNNNFSLEILTITALVALALVLTLRQMKRSGQTIRWKGIFNRQVSGTVLLLGAALAIAVWSVNRFRRPGSMTPLEAQGMEMTAPAPEGTLPVTLAKVELKPFGTTVTYTGQAVGFVELDVIARVGGAITWMPYYVGDKVAKGQVLAKLDTTQIDPTVSEKSAQALAASQGVDIAKSDYLRALAEVSQADAERAMRESEIDEAKSMVAASKQEMLSAEANLRLEKSSVADAESQVASAEADRDYWAQELGRTQQLYQKGAVSKDELQKTQASASSASAKLRQAVAGVNEASARVQGATAMVSKATAETAAAQNKLQESQAEHHVHMAHVRSALAAAESAKQRISQAISESQMAQAGLEGATTLRGYAELRSEVDGVVTARVMSPGVIISPGQSVLRVAQTSPIRLQANVPESDLARIRLGAIVKVKQVDGSEPIKVQVTSVSPSVDPASRTGVVEALLPNPNGRYKPGQYVTMEISIGSDAPEIVIPNDCIQTEEDGTYVWTIDAGTDNQFTASRRPVHLVGRSGTRVAISSGLRVGQQVIVAPPQGLIDGTRVTSENANPAQVAQAPRAEQTIEITAAGYNPPSISVPAGKELMLTFIRRDDKSCGTEVIFPDLGIRKALPLNQPVMIDIPPQPAGKALNFTCPMNMLNGKAVAK